MTFSPCGHVFPGCHALSHAPELPCLHTDLSFTSDYFRHLRKSRAPSFCQIIACPRAQFSRLLFHSKPIFTLQVCSVFFFCFPLIASRFRFAASLSDYTALILLSPLFDCLHFLTTLSPNALALLSCRLGVSAHPLSAMPPPSKEELSLSLFFTSSTFCA